VQSVVAALLRSFSDRVDRGGMSFFRFREATPTPKIHRARRAQWSFWNCVKIERAISFWVVRLHNLFAIAAAPAARMAHLKMMATQRFSSIHSTAAKRNAPMKIIAEVCRRTSAAVIQEAYHAVCAPLSGAEVMRKFCAAI
jgi:hypothetical protein